MTAVVAEFTAGVYDGMPDDLYHADPVPGGSLSASGAKLLLAPSCPAKFRYAQDNPPPPKDHFDLGTAAHKMVLGAGPELAVINAKDWKTKAAQNERDAARAEGFTPVLAAQHEQVKAMAEALRRHEIASALFNPANGKAEQSLFWHDPRFGIWKRSRLDWLPDAGARNRLIIGDYKTCDSAEPGRIAKAVLDYGYYMQAPFYIDGIRALGLADDPAFVFVFQEKTPPYLITHAELDLPALEAGRLRNRLAAEIFRDCTEAGVWPGYSDGIEVVSLPAWAIRRFEESA